MVAQARGNYLYFEVAWRAIEGGPARAASFRIRGADRGLSKPPQSINTSLDPHFATESARGSTSVRKVGRGGGRGGAGTQGQTHQGEADSDNGLFYRMH